MARFTFDETAAKRIAGVRMQYGILRGSGDVVFLKAGSDVPLRGKKDKYIRMAHRVHQRTGATVICANNPSELMYQEQIACDKAMIAQVAGAGAVDLVGSSDGGYHNLLLAQQLPQARKLLGINPSLTSQEDFIQRLQALPQVQKILVYGTKDELFSFVPQLQELDCPGLQVQTVEGADHSFHGMLEESIALMDLL